jgi:hypothetical protein
MHEILHTNPILHGVYHSILILPLLYLAYLVLEFIEHKANDKFKIALAEDRRTGPVVGGAVGLLPLCGFTDLGAGLYAGKVISLGTLIALFLTSSGETLLLTTLYPNKLLSVIVLLLIKFIVAVICGFVVDLCLRNRQPDIHIHDLCEEDHCHCEQINIWLSALKHTLPVFAFVLCFNLLIGVLEWLGVIEVFAVLIEAMPYLGVIFSAVIGLIPGCAPLVLLLGLFGEGVISSAAMLAGLLTSVGTGFIVLYKTNKSWKQNLLITLFILLVGIITGGFFELTDLLTTLGI